MKKIPTAVQWEFFWLALLKNLFRLPLTLETFVLGYPGRAAQTAVGADEHALAGIG